MRKLILSLTFLFCVLTLNAQEEVSAPPLLSSSRESLSKLTEFLGLTLEYIIGTQGFPQDMYSVRGPSEGQDSVVFLYENGLSFYWADRHVWQVRIDRDFHSDGMDLKLGMSREAAEALLGKPDLKEDDLSIYKLPQRGYPVACALYFDEGLSDLYIYRSDF